MRKLLAATIAVSALAVMGVGVSAQEGAPIATGKGWKHLDCSVSHFAPVDPIVFPGQPDTSHNHTFVGNRSTNENTTNASLEPFESTCVGDDELKQHLIPRDRSAYWTPTAYTANGSRIQVLTTAAQYAMGKRERNLQAFPPGYRVIAGNSAGGAAEAGARRVWFYSCPGGQVTPGTSTVAPSCATKVLQLTVYFPDCWDGEHLDSVNHKSHAAYAQPNGDRLVCPPGYPVAVPELRLQIKYASFGGQDFKLAGGSGVARTLRGIDTSHADFMNGWVQSHLEHIVEVCLNADEYCGGTSDPVPGH